MSPIKVAIVLVLTVSLAYWLDLEGASPVIFVGVVVAGVVEAVSRLRPKRH